MASILYIDEEIVRKLLDWKSTFKAVETALKCTNEKNVFQNARTLTKVLDSDGLLFTMPGYLKDPNFGALACKFVTYFGKNEERKINLPNILANISIFNEETGELRAIVAGTEITAWRTAAASAVATWYLRKGKEDKILAILGAGVQGHSHAIGFYNIFEYKQINIWNHNYPKALKLVEELNAQYGNYFKAYESNEECVKEADVIVTATSASSPILKLEWIKNNVHINAVGAGHSHHSELDESIYKCADVYIDYWAGAKSELSGLEKMGIKFMGEIGGLINETVKPSGGDKITVFQSLGMAVEDCAMARMIYDKYLTLKLN